MVALVGHSHTAFPSKRFWMKWRTQEERSYELRRKLLPINRACSRCWTSQRKKQLGAKLPPGVGRGIAGHFSFDSYVAQVVEASVAKDAGVRVHRVVCAVDCGTVINPDTVKAQMEGGIVFG